MKRASSSSLQEKIKEVFESSGVEGKLSYSDLKHRLTGESRALQYDWAGAGLVRGRVHDSLQDLADTTDRLVTFDEFWAEVTGAAAEKRLDPAKEAEHYLQSHKLVPLLESMAAALLYEMPSNPRTFLANKLEALRATGKEPHHFTDEDLTALFGIFDVSGRGVVTTEQTGEAIKVLTGEKRSVGEGIGAEKHEELEKDKFIQHTRAALRGQIATPSVAPSR